MMPDSVQEQNLSVVRRLITQGDASDLSVVDEV